MKKSNLVFETVGDINMEYPYLCVYSSIDDKNPFMDISINSSKKIEYMIYPRKDNKILSDVDWTYIKEKAELFYVETLKRFG